MASQRRLLISTCCCPLVIIMAVLAVAAAVSGAGGNNGGNMHHLHLYMHEWSSGPSPTAALIVNGTGAPLMPGAGVRFGDTMVIDDLLTEGPSRASRAVGRAQGMYVTASLSPGRPAMLLTVNLLLTAGRDAGSSVTVVGRNEVTAPVRELPVVGGTGRFRMATGYVLLKTVSWEGRSAVLELDVFVRDAGAANA